MWEKWRNGKQGFHSEGKLTSFGFSLQGETGLPSAVWEENSSLLLEFSPSQGKFFTPPHSLLFNVGFLLEIFVEWSQNDNVGQKWERINGEKWGFDVWSLAWDSFKP